MPDGTRHFNDRFPQFLLQHAIGLIQSAPRGIGFVWSVAFDVPVAGAAHAVVGCFGEGDRQCAAPALAAVGRSSRGPSLDRATLEPVARQPDRAARELRLHPGAHRDGLVELSPLFGRSGGQDREAGRGGGEGDQVAFGRAW